MTVDLNLGTAPSVRRVRTPQPSDYERMADLAGQLGYQCRAEEIHQRLSHMQDPNQYGIFVAELDSGQVAGWIGVFVFRAVALDGFAEVSGLVVDENARGRGIGKVLLGAAEVWAQKAGCRDISVNCNVVRKRAHRFYTTNGYELIKTQRVFHKIL
jgi:GNAT superfamily N-acetyltransferase